MKKTPLDQNTITSLFIENLSCSYGQVEILKNCTLCLKPGELVCLCGSNGSGKSTLLSVLGAVNDSRLKITTEAGENSKIQTPAISTINDDIIPISSLSRKETAAVISYLQQEEYSTWDFSVRDFVLQGRFCHTENANYSKEDMDLAEKAMAETGIMELADRTVHSLSGGEFQKVRIARCLCQQPLFLLLDEPASSLDFVYEPKLLQQLKNLAHQQNKAILVSIHDLNMAARFADKILLLKKGMPVIQGTPKEVFTEETLASIYDCKCKIYTHPVYNCPQVCDFQ